MKHSAVPYFLVTRRTELGESISRTSFGLMQVSIPEAALITFEVNDSNGYRELLFREHEFSSVGSAVETVRNTVLVATSKGLLEIDPKAQTRLTNWGLPSPSFGTFESPDAMERIRFNDGKVGPNGHGYFGIIFDTSEARSKRAGEGCLVSIGADGHWKTCIEGLTTANGGVWDEVTKESATFYLNDTPTRKMKVYSHEFERDRFIHREDIDLSAEAFGENPDTWGRPDGATIAYQKSGPEVRSVLLVAMFAGRAVLVIDPKKRGKESLVGKIDVDASKVTSVAILDSFAYITTGKAENEPNSGMTFRADLSKMGIVEREFPLAWGS